MTAGRASRDIAGSEPPAAQAGGGAALQPEELEVHGWTAHAVRSAADFYRAHMADDALMVLPRAVLRKPEVLAAVDVREPLEEYEIGQLSALEPLSGMKVLVYRIRAKRAVEPWYEALISSVYTTDSSDRWRLLLHQQTPLS